MRASAPHLVRRGIASSLAAVLALTVLAPSHPAAAAPVATAAASLAATTATDEAQFFALLNQTRAQLGLPALQHDAALASSSRIWSTTMGAKDLLYHDPNLGAIVTSIEPSWRSAAENVGFGYQVQQLHDAFMASAGHRANIVASRFNRVGIGVAHAGTKIWVTVRFIEGPALVATAAAPAPTPPGVRTVLTGDFNGDGRDDMLTYGPGAEADELWFGLPGGTMRQVPVNIKGQYQPVAGDFDGDGRTEILWYAPGGAADSLWKWSGTGWTKVAKTINGRYTARAGDFDGDGADDIFWYGPGTAPDYRWYGNRNGSFTSVATTVAGSFIPVVGDFDGNGGDDVLWYGRGSAPDVVWYSTGQRGSQRSARTTIGGSHTPFAGDFDGNGVDDLFLYTPGTAADYTWFSTRTTFAATKVARTVNGTYVPGAGDFDGNGVDDAIWFSPSGAAGDPLWWGVRSTLDFLTSVLLPG
jgi:uncharacterized protein YkwD